MSHLMVEVQVGLWVPTNEVCAVLQWGTSQAVKLIYPNTNYIAATPTIPPVTSGTISVSVLSQP